MRVRVTRLSVRVCAWACVRWSGGEAFCGALVSHPALTDYAALSPSFVPKSILLCAADTTSVPALPSSGFRAARLCLVPTSYPFRVGVGAVGPGRLAALSPADRYLVSTSGNAVHQASVFARVSGGFVLFHTRRLNSAAVVIGTTQSVSAWKYTVLSPPRASYPTFPALPQRLIYVCVCVVRFLLFFFFCFALDLRFPFFLRVVVSAFLLALFIPSPFCASSLSVCCACRLASYLCRALRCGAVPPQASSKVSFTPSLGLFPPLEVFRVLDTSLSPSLLCAGR